MALVKLGSIVSDIVGSVGQETYLRTPAGLVVRARVSPVQPASALRDQVQLNFTNVSQAWSGTLTELQRKTWRSYGKNWPLPNAFGKRVVIGGFTAFCRSNLVAKTVSSAFWHLSAPERNPLVIPDFTATAAALGAIIKLNIVLGTQVPIENGFYLIISAGTSTNAGVIYYSSPWRVSAISLRTGGAWATDITDLSLSTWSGIGPKIYIKMYMYDSTTGAISTPTQHGIDVTPEA